MGDLPGARARRGLPGDPVDAPPLAARVGRPLARRGRRVGRRARDALARSRRRRARPRGARRGGGRLGARVRLPRRGEALRARARPGRRHGPRALRAARAPRRLRGARRRPRGLGARLARGDRRPPRPRRGRAGRRGPACDRPRARAARQHRARARRLVRRRRRVRRLRAARGRRALPPRGRRRPAGHGGACSPRWPRSRQRSPPCPPDAPPELRSRARSLEGIVLGKLGQTAASARSRCTTRSPEALAAGHPASAAAAYQALAVVHENAGEFGAASGGLRGRHRLLREHRASPTTGHVCSACLCHVLRQRGEWRRSLALCRSLLDDPVGRRRIARDRRGRDEPDPREPRRAPARAPARHGGGAGRAAACSVFGAEMECSWTFARLELLEGSEDAALEHCRDVLRRWEESEDLHYSLNALAWSAGVFAALRAGRGPEPRRAGAHGDRRRRTATARRSRCSPARSASSRAPRATPDAAVEHFQRAIELHREIELPHDRAELLVSAAAAARDAGLDEQAREWLADARLQARRLGARPLQAAAERALAELGGARREPRGRSRPHAAAAAGDPARRRGPHEPRDRDRAVPLGAHGRHARPPLADRARLPVAHGRRAQGRRARPARARLRRPEHLVPA